MKMKMKVYEDLKTYMLKILDQNPLTVKAAKKRFFRFLKLYFGTVKVIFNNWSCNQDEADLIANILMVCFKVENNMKEKIKWGDEYFISKILFNRINAIQLKNIELLLKLFI